MTCVRSGGRRRQREKEDEEEEQQRSANWFLREPTVFPFRDEMDAHTFALHSVSTVNGCSRGLALFGRRSPSDMNAPGQKQRAAGRNYGNMAGLRDERLLREWQGGRRAADDEIVGGGIHAVQSRRGGAGREHFLLPDGFHHWIKDEWK
ncbi:hypothetical protein COCMIDRAFT_22952 [Bipolaris oryzae ATCC 44560]|uniref:Uncharacterized protein n=1 Tax=Bipolaris oryzae ATCC 44560 TaxID=930090 RepID=W7A044_COCMI|nr:uncharacterized protein COCMIDRAFT_22952 [Bipolaris oryzae ATCC 44560]EUC49371.1 hypothetical protein COCMIDRAFT_22952 [Bipolaris oryzae ATCC 44560]